MELCCPNSLVKLRVGQTYLQRTILHSNEQTFLNEAASTRVMIINEQEAANKAVLTFFVTLLALLCCERSAHS